MCGILPGGRATDSVKNNAKPITDFQSYFDCIGAGSSEGGFGFYHPQSDLLNYTSSSGKVVSLKMTKEELMYAFRRQIILQHDGGKGMITNGTSTPNRIMPLEVQYLTAKTILSNTCIKTIFEPPLEVSATGDRVANIDWIGLNADGNLVRETKKFPISEGYTKSGLTNKYSKYTCQGRIDSLNRHDDPGDDVPGAYYKWALRNEAVFKKIEEDARVATQDTTTGNPESCGAQVQGIGWIICPVVGGLMKLNDAMWAVASSLLEVDPLKQSGTSDPTYKAWEAIRNIANVIFVIFFLMIIYSQLAGGGFTNYGVKKILPKIMIAAILVNSSYIIVALAVDLANVVGGNLYGFLKGLANFTPPSWSGLLDLGVGSAAAAVGVTALVIGAGGIGAAFLMLLPMALMAAIGFAVAMLTLIFRQAMIPVLVVIAPLAFVAYLLPNTEQWFKKWRSMFSSLLMMYPIAAVIFGGATFASSVVMSSGGKGDTLVALMILVMPLFALPFISRQGGALLSKIGGALSKMTDKARAPISSWAKGHQDSAKSKYLNKNSEKGLYNADGSRRKPFSPKRLATMGSRLTRRTTQGNAARAITRQEAIQANQKHFENRVHSDGSDGLDRVKGMRGQEVHRNKSFDALNQTSREAGIAKMESDTRVSRLNKRNVNDRELKAKDENQLATNKGGEKYMENSENVSLRREVATSKEALDKATHKSDEAVMTDDGSASYQEYMSTVEGAKVAEQDLKAATSLRDTQIEKKDSMLHAKTRATSASEQLANAEADTTKIIETAAALDSLTEEELKELENTNPNLLEQARSLGTGVAGQLRENRMQQKVIAQATTEAKQQQQRDYARSLFAVNEDTGKQEPTELAKQAAGVGGEKGVNRARAAAAQVMDEFKQQNIKAAGILIEDDHYTQPEIFNLATQGMLRDGTPATVEQQRAALENICSTGDKNKMQEMLNAYDLLPEGTDVEKEHKMEMMTALGKGAVKAGKPLLMYGSYLGKMNTAEVPGRYAIGAELGPDGKVLRDDDGNPKLIYPEGSDDQPGAGMLTSDTALREYIDNGKFSAEGLANAGERDLHGMVMSIDRMMSLTGANGEPLIDPASGRPMRDMVAENPDYKVFYDDNGKGYSLTELIDPNKALQLMETITEVENDPMLKGKRKQEEKDKLALLRSQLGVFVDAGTDDNKGSLRQGSSSMDAGSQELLKQARVSDFKDRVKQDDQLAEFGQKRVNGTKPKPENESYDSYANRSTKARDRNRRS